VLRILMQCPSASWMSVRVLHDMRKGVGQHFVLHTEHILCGHHGNPGTSRRRSDGPVISFASEIGCLAVRDVGFTVGDSSSPRPLSKLPGTRQTVTECSDSIGW